ncbi:MAG: Trk system potassium transporter TrkA [Acidobacteria bacterium]|nr:MAG: Trk system potassium transporter TrkA [Acidobacteriota bacterium]
MTLRVVIVGAGVVGRTCALRLSRDGHDVVVVERDPQKAREILDKLDVQVITGNGCSLSVLREAGLGRADLLLAVTDSDEMNLIAALLAGTAFDVRTKVVRLRADEYLDNVAELARSWRGKTYGFSPDRVAAARIGAMLDVPHAVDVAEMLDGSVIVAGFRVGPECPLVGRSMASLRKQYRDAQVLVAAIYRKGKALIPGGSTALEVGDVAYFSAVKKEIGQVVRLMGHRFDREPRVVIGGGGHIARNVARYALERGLRTTLILSRRDEAEELAVAMPEATVLCGPVTDEDLLAEAGIDSHTTFVAATRNHENNLLSSVLARRAGASRVITLVDNPTYILVAEQMGLDAVVSPRLGAVSAILRFVRGAHYEEVASLPHELIEVAAIDVDESSPLAGKPLGEVGLPPGVLITAVRTPAGVSIPGGRDTIPPGSHALAFVLAEAAERFAEWLER